MILGTLALRFWRSKYIGRQIRRNRASAGPQRWICQCWKHVCRSAQDLGLQRRYSVGGDDTGKMKSSQDMRLNSRRTEPTKKGDLSTSEAQSPVLLATATYRIQHPFLPQDSSLFLHPININQPPIRKDYTRHRSPEAK